MDTHSLADRVRKLEKALSDFSEELQLALRYVPQDAASSLTKSRIVLEKLLIRVYTVEMGRVPRRALLGDMLADNQFTRKIERRILSRMNNIRDMGNLGLHGESVEPSDATRVLDDLCEVLDWYLRSYVVEASDLAPRPARAQGQKVTYDPFLTELGRRLLSAESAWELRGILYEVEAYLARHPHSVEGRMLKDRIELAVRRADAMERPRAEMPPAKYRAMASHSGCLPVLGACVLIIALIIIYFKFYK